MDYYQDECYVTTNQYIYLYLFFRARDHYWFA
jgi:hypothetical protein